MKDQVTLRDVYDVASRLEEKFDKRIYPLEKDISELKGFRNQIIGMSVVISLFIGGVVNWFWQTFEGKR